MDRLSRSAFELDIPDMRTTRQERERSRREMRELNEKLAEQVESVGCPVLSHSSFEPRIMISAVLKIIDISKLI